jgi:hypothetical protein
LPGFRLDMGRLFVGTEWIFRRSRRSRGIWLAVGCTSRVSNGARFDDDRDLLPVDPLVDVLQVLKIPESGTEAKLPGRLRQPVRPYPAGLCTAGDYRQPSSRDSDAHKVQHHFQACRIAISRLLSERSDVQHKTGACRFFVGNAFSILTITGR